MRVVQLKANEKYGDFDVAQVFDDDFLTNRSNWKTAGVPEKFNGMDLKVIEDDELDIQPGYSYDGTNYYADKTLPRAKIDKLGEIAYLRWQNEESGITWKGNPIDTTRGSQGMLGNAVSRAQIDPSYTTNWKTKNGFIKVVASDVLEIGMAVSQHVEACFAAEKTLFEQVVAATTIEAVEAVNWVHVDPIVVA